MGGGDCFIAGTEIATLRGPVKIENVKVLDRVLTFSVDKRVKKIEAREVFGVMSQYHTGVGDDYMVVIEFGNGSLNVNTATHPYFVKDTGWCSWLPEVTMRKYDLKGINQLQVGDVALYFNGEEVKDTLIKSIKVDRNPVITYNLSSVDANHNFFANSILVHNKGGGEADTSPDTGNFGGGVGPTGEQGSGESDPDTGNFGGYDAGFSGVEGHESGNQGTAPGFGNASASPGTESDSGMSPGTEGNLAAAEASTAAGMSDAESEATSGMEGNQAVQGAMASSLAGNLSGDMASEADMNAAIGESESALGSFATTLSNISKAAALVTAIAPNPVTAAGSFGTGLLAGLMGLADSLGLGNSGESTPGFGDIGQPGPASTGPHGPDININQDVVEPIAKTPTAIDTPTATDTPPATDTPNDPVKQYLEDLRRRRDARFGFFDTIQFEAGENPFIHIPTSWGEGGAGKLDVESQNSSEFIFG